MRTFNYPVIINGDMSGNIECTAALLTSIVLISFQCSWTGTPTGSIKLQASNDGVVYSDVSGSSINTGGAPGDVLYNLSEIGYLYLRAVYTRVSGTGALKIIANGKGV